MTLLGSVMLKHNLRHFDMTTPSSSQNATVGEGSFRYRVADGWQRLPQGWSLVEAPGDFYAPHDVWVDSRGDLYVGEVTWSAGGNRGLVDASCPSLQKFVRE